MPLFPKFSKHRNCTQGEQNISPPVSPSSSPNSTLKQKQQQEQKQQQVSTTFETDYEAEKGAMLGAGQFGQVIPAVNRKTGQYVAVKVIEWRKLLENEMAKPENLKAEMALLKSLRHPGIVALEKLYSTSDKLYLVMERAFGGDYLDKILNSKESRLTERVSKFYLWQILIALKYLHGNRISHRDLKPENVLLFTNQEFTLCKLCDFGFARIIGEDSFMKSIVGTAAYVAPEVLKAGKNGSGYKSTVDIWSMGVIAYVSLSGQFPFSDQHTVTEKSLKPGVLFPAQIWDSISNEAKSWVTTAFSLDPEKRFDAVTALSTKWLQDKQLKTDLLQLEAVYGDGIMEVSRFLMV